MAAPLVSGIAADLLSAHPDWTPDQVKGALTGTGNLRRTTGGAREVAAHAALYATANELVANQGLTPSSLLDPATGDVDWARASWGRASWKSDAARASWGRASWKSFFGDWPSASGELRGGSRGRVPQARVRRATG